MDIEEVYALYVGDVYRYIYSLCRIVRILLVGVASWMSKRNITGFEIGIVGLLANIVVLISTFLLLLSFGISESSKAF